MDGFRYLNANLISCMLSALLRVQLIIVFFFSGNFTPMTYSTSGGNSVLTSHGLRMGADLGVHAQPIAGVSPTAQPQAMPINAALCPTLEARVPIGSTIVTQGTTHATNMVSNITQPTAVLRQGTLTIAGPSVNTAIANPFANNNKTIARSVVGNAVINSAAMTGTGTVGKSVLAGTTLVGSGGQIVGTIPQALVSGAQIVQGTVIKLRSNFVFCVEGHSNLT